MAYKSRVSNKYMGATFAGQVNAASDSEAMDLARTLQRTVNPALERIYDRNVEKQKDEAKTKINQLFLEGKKSDQIQAEILEGKHPELSGKYVEKTVSYHTGRHEAVDAITKIESNKDKYDHRETNLPAFYKEYLPSFADRDGSYTLGFAAVFNQYKANEAIKDAEVRAKYAKEEKLNQGAKIISAVPVEEVWNTINSLNVPVPPEEGDSKPREFYSKEELNSVAIKHANNLLDMATTPEEIDRALKVLTADRGLGKDGTKLGSLVSTKRSDIADLVGKLNRRRTTLVTNNRIENEYKETKQKQDLVKKLFEKNTDGSEKSFQEKQKFLEDAKTFGDISFYNSINNIITSDISQVNNDPNQLGDFMTSILEGTYDDFTDMVKDFDKNKFSQDQLSKAITYWNTWKNNYDKGVKPIWQTNDTYTNSTAYILDAVAEPFRDKLGNIMKGGEFAQYRARNYIIQTIEEEEISFYNKNNRKPTELERQQIITKIGDYVIKQFTTRNKNVELQTFTEQEAAAFKADQERKDKELKYQQSGIDVPLLNLQTTLQNKTNVPKLPKMETSWFKLDSTDRKNYIEKTVIPTVQQFLTQSFGVQLTPEMWDSLTDEDAQNMYGNVAQAFGIDPNIVQIAIGNILRGQQ